MINPKVRRILDTENISEEEFEEMVKAAAPVTHERGNRRFHHWLFYIVAGEVVDMQSWEVPERHLTGEQDLIVVDECEECEGFGCKECGWTGEIKTHYTKAFDKPKKHR